MDYRMKQKAVVSKVKKRNYNDKTDSNNTLAIDIK